MRMNKMLKLKMIIGFLFSIGMMVWNIMRRKKMEAFVFYLSTCIIAFAIIIFLGQIIGG
jgi:hypothetical protein